MTDRFLPAQVVIGMDVAASEFYDNKAKTYDLNFKEEVVNSL
jgi:enolase